MKLKTKAKILSGILSLSYTLGLAASNTIYAAKNPTRLRIERRTTIANETGIAGPIDLRDALDYAYDAIEITGVPHGVVQGLEDAVTDGNITLTIGNLSAVPTATELADALEVAYEYFSLTQDPIFINHLIEYISSRPLDLTADYGVLLHKAVSLGYGCCNFIRFLLERCGVDVNIRDSEGSTPLHTAARRPDEQVLTLLLEFPGIRPDIKDNAGNSAYYYAASGPQTVMSFAGQPVESIEGRMVRIFNEHGVAQ